ncbi:MAG: type I restriction endonuclease subunit S [Candidatus Riflebacteria bacterium HGW-Riflebacteria-1]|jgi:type I restriction enzyme S subunit|nr:MAG: type I restriction endonuclease subunit S [Candidatus Riflebacteria bacterium HGW-Riflebacteria-1]
MNKQTTRLLEQHFDTAFDAPDGIKKLRELILTLAMQGKLVPQDPDDQPASELLKEIEAEKKRLIKEGKIKPSKPLPPIKPEEIPLETQKKWFLVRLGDLGIAQTGTTPPTNNKTNYGNHIPFIGPGSIKDNKIDYSGEGLSPAGLLKGRLIEKNSVIMVCIGGSIGKHAINEVQITCNQQINALTPFKAVNFRFMFFALAAPFFQQKVLALAGGSATPIINKQKWASITIPMPPQNEQQRIVEKIDQLMARVDELEKLRNEREEKRLKIHAAAIDQLLSAKSDDDFAAAWGFITGNFDSLYSVKENVAELRKAILQLAVMGRLVPQDPNDQPASELLKEIEAEKKRLIKEGKIKPSKPLPPIKPEEFSFTIPKTWCWSKMGTTGYSRLGKMLDKSKNKGICKPYLRNTNVQWARFDLSDIKEMKFETSELDEFKILPGDLLICEGGEPGRCAIWNETSREIYFQKALHRVRPYPGIEVKYLAICLKVDAFTGNLNRYFTGATIKHFPGEKLINYIFPLPPSLEQQRIVEKVDQLMALCDKLERRLTDKTEKQAGLLNSLMAKV